MSWSLDSMPTGCGLRCFVGGSGGLQTLDHWRCEEGSGGPVLGTFSQVSQSLPGIYSHLFAVMLNDVVRQCCVPFNYSWHLAGSARDLKSPPPPLPLLPPLNRHYPHYPHLIATTATKLPLPPPNRHYPYRRRHYRHL
jgi:hypothetical protein